MSVTWIAAADALPDTDTTVLLHSPMSNEPVWLGWWDSAAKVWRYVEGSVARGVTHWAEIPDAPTP